MIELSTMKNEFTCDGMIRETAAGTTVWSAKPGRMNVCKCIGNHRDENALLCLFCLSHWSAQLFAPAIRAKNAGLSRLMPAQVD